MMWRCWGDGQTVRADESQQYGIVHRHYFEHVRREVSLSREREVCICSRYSFFWPRGFEMVLEGLAGNACIKISNSISSMLF